MMADDSGTSAAGSPAGPGFGRRMLRLVVVLAALVLLVVAAGYGWFRHAVSQPMDFGDQSWTIERGETLGRIADRLQHEGIINETLSLRLLARHQENGHQVRAGEYRFPAGLSREDFLHRIVNGEGLVGVSVTIVEGWTFRQMREELAKTGSLVQVTRDMDDQQVMAAIGYPDLHPEGRFFPDTYSYHAGEEDLVVLKKAFRLMQDKLDQAWRQRAPDQVLDSADDALILASIIEKETGALEEQPLIAGVFHNRLEKGMRLQTDPTVIYGLGEEFDGNITRKHLETDNPYNTYTRKGLTPTPISLPGMSALLAAVNPADTDAYYFVARGEGRHAFSRTLEEHNAAVRKYILKRNDG